MILHSHFSRLLLIKPHSKVIIFGTLLTFVSIIGCGGDSKSSDITPLAARGVASTHTGKSIGRISGEDRELNILIPIQPDSAEHQICFDDVSGGTHQVRLTSSEGIVRTLTKGECVTDTEDFRVAVVHDGHSGDVPVLVLDDELTKDEFGKAILPAETPRTMITAGGCTNCSFDGISVENANFSNGTYVNCTFDNSDLSRSDFSSSTFDSVTFNHSVFQSTRFIYSTFKQFFCRESDFSYADFDTTVMAGEAIVNCNFSHSTFVSSRMMNVQFVSADFTSAILIASEWVENRLHGVVDFTDALNAQGHRCIHNDPECH